MAGFEDDSLAFVVAGAEIHSATLLVLVQQMVFVLALVMVKRCVDSGNPMPNWRSHGTRRETVRVGQSEQDGVALARLVLQGWPRRRQTLGQVFHHEKSETGIPANSFVSIKNQETEYLLYALEPMTAEMPTGPAGESGRQTHASESSEARWTGHIAHHPWCAS